MTTTQPHKIIDKKTGREVRVGQTLLRKNYVGFKTRYEILSFEPMHDGRAGARVRKLGQDDAWVYLFMPLSALLLDEVRL